MSVPRSVVGSDATQNPSSSVQKPLLPLEFLQNSSKVSLENEVDGVLGKSFSPVPSKSREMASKIYQQLDKIGASKEKTLPTKLSPSMLTGKAFKSSDIESSKLLDYVQADNRPGGSSTTLVPLVQEPVYHKRDRVEENGAMNSLGCFDSVTPVNTSAASVSVKDMTNFSSKSEVNLISHCSRKKHAFQMSGVGLGYNALCFSCIIWHNFSIILHGFLNLRL